MTSTYTNFPAEPLTFEPALPPSHQDMHFRHFPAPASKAFRDWREAGSMLSVLVTPLVGNWHFQERAAVSTS